MGAKYVLKLYLTGKTTNSQRALRNLKNILNNELKGLYILKIVDVLQNPQLAEEDKILATPALAKTLPLPIRRIIGDLSEQPEGQSSMGLPVGECIGDDML